MVELDNLKLEIKEYEAPLAELKSSLDLESKANRIAELSRLMEEPGFWDDQKEAQKLTREKKILENKVSEYDSLAGDFDDIGVRRDGRFLD